MRLKYVGNHAAVIVAGQRVERGAETEVAAELAERLVTQPDWEAAKAPKTKTKTKTKTKANSADTKAPETNESESERE